MIFRLASAVLLIIVTGAKPAAPAVVVWTTDALHKIRPSDLPPAPVAAEAHLAAAQNEFEPFQIVLRSEQSGAAGIDVEVSDLTGPRGTLFAKNNITVYLEKYIHITTPSSLEGEEGDWPDALIPKVDRYAGQKRNAFPFALTARRNQPVWIEVYVPLGTAAGDYKGQAQVTVNGEAAQTIPITLRVWDFALPSTSSLKNTFGFNGTAALKEHFSRYTSDDDLAKITRLYEKAALLHRISVHGGRMVAPRIRSGEMGIDWLQYDAEVAPFLDGKVLGPDDPLPHAAATTADLRVPPGLDAQQLRPYFAQWIRHFRDKGWSSRLFYYLWDEPTPAMYEALSGKGRAAHLAAPEVRNLVTVARNGSLEGIVDIWAPLINCLQDKPGFPSYCQVSAPRDAYAHGLWWYQSCASHGCNITGGEYFRGWPSYMIDASAVGNRVFQWMAWKYRVEGELYFNMDEAFARGPDPWDSQLLYGGNGDGTLFYPGKPSRIGGHTDIPIESIRLKLIREGLEDYEYLHLCEQSGLGELATRVANNMATSLYQWDHRPESLYAYRREMGEALSKISHQTGQAAVSSDSPKMR